MTNDSNGAAAGREHNYRAKIQRLFEEGKFRSNEVTLVMVAHDDQCAIYRNEPCDCDPDIYLGTGKNMRRIP